MGFVPTLKAVPRGGERDYWLQAPTPQPEGCTKGRCTGPSPHANGWWTSKVDLYILPTPTPMDITLGYIALLAGAAEGK